jgi:predicted nucleotidyltransferase
MVTPHSVSLAPGLLQLAAPQAAPRIPPHFEYAAHALIQRALEHHDIALAIAYGQFPWESESMDGGNHPLPGPNAAQAVPMPETLELQLALILDDDVRDFVAAKLQLTRIAYDTFLETGVEIAPYPIAITHWYQPAKAPNPGLIDDLRRNGLRLDIDRARAMPLRRALRREPKASSEIMAALTVIAEGLFQRYALVALHYIPRRHHLSRGDDPAPSGAQHGSGALLGNAVNGSDGSASPRYRPEPREQGPVDVLVDFGGRPSIERLLGVQDELESALGLPVQLLTESSMRRELRAALLLQALEVGGAPGDPVAGATPRSEAPPRGSPRARSSGDFASH